jgi:histone deacetylase complex subunit SAP30
MGINSNQININSSNNNNSNNPIINTSTNSVSNQSICCLIEDNHRCQRVAGNASYSKRIEKQVTQRKLRLVVDQRSNHSYICEHHKQMIQSIRTSAKRKRKDSEDDNSNDVESDSQDVDLLALQVNTLRRYKRHYRIQTRPGLNKSQLAEVLLFI